MALPHPGPGHDVASLSAPERAFVLSFLSSGGTITPFISLSQLPHAGRCYIANEDIPEGTDLFTIPRHALLNTRNSTLPDQCRAYEARRGLHTAKEENDMSLDDIQVGGSDTATTPQKWDDLDGWSPLILCMMWEQWRSSTKVAVPPPPSSSIDLATLGSSLRGVTRPMGEQDWRDYLAIMPGATQGLRDFAHLPMFWSQDDIAQLRGTSVPERVGREDADAEYWDKVRPFIKSRAEVFLGTGTDDEDAAVERLLDQHYSLEQFHVQGSRILSRSFHVKKEGQKEVNDGEAVAVDAADADTSMGAADEGDSHGGEGEGEGEGDDDDDDDDDDDEEEREDTSDISMVPMADMLNASYASENARLFYQSAHCLTMRATRNIKRGEEILNTYGDPPNADLLRRYGYVDAWNGADEAEISAEVLVDAALQVLAAGPSRKEALLARIAHCVSLGLEESYVLTYAFPPSEAPPHRPSYHDGSTTPPSGSDLKSAISQLDEELLVAARALTLFPSDDEGSAAWTAQYEERERLPKARLDETVVSVLLRAIELRLAMYEGGASSARDEERLYGGEGQSEGQTAMPEGNERNALVVRLGEKRVLESNALALRAFAEENKKREEAANKSKSATTAKRRGDKAQGSGDKAGKRARK